MGWAAGFVAIENEAAAPGVPRPAVLLEYGTHDELFPFEQIARPMREQLEALRLRGHLPRGRGRPPLALGRVPGGSARLVLLRALGGAHLTRRPEPRGKRRLCVCRAASGRDSRCAPPRGDFYNRAPSIPAWGRRGARRAGTELAPHF